MKITLLYLALLSITLVSCGKNLKYFTKDLHQEYRWSDQELKRIQYYLSSDIVLYKRVNNESSKIKSGKIIVRDGAKVEEITFKKGTPGVFLFSPGKDHFAISFENGDKYLMFGPNKKAGGRYVLLAKEWERRSGKITYDDETYLVASESAYAALLVDLKGAKKISYESRDAKGRTIK